MRPDEDLLTPLEAAAYLRVHRDTLYLYIKHGIVPARKIGGRWRVAISDLQHLLPSTASTPTGVGNISVQNVGPDFPADSSSTIEQVPTAPDPEPLATGLSDQEVTASQVSIGSRATANIERPPTATTPPAIDAPDILIAEDDPIIRTLIRDILQPSYVVREAADGSEALAMIGRQKPDLLLLDILMPEMSGLTVCRTLRERYNSLELPIIFLSALTDPRERRVAIELGANGYLAKPFTPTQLLTTIETALRARGTFRTARHTSYS